MNEDSSQGKTELVLPIVCPHCSNELNLAMLFALLPPDEVIPTSTEEVDDNPNKELNEEEGDN